MGLHVYTENRPLVKRTYFGSVTLTYGHNNCMVVIDSEVDCECQLTKLAPGFHCWVIQKGEGKITFSPVNGATVLNRNGKYQTTGLGAMIKILCDDNDLYYISDTSGDGSVSTDPPPAPAPLPCTNINAPGGTIVVPGGYWINGITVKKLADGTSDDFSIGTAAAGKQIYDDTLPTGAIGEVAAITIQRMIDANTTLYFTLGFNACVKIFKQ